MAATAPAFAQAFTAVDVSPGNSPGSSLVAPWGDFLSCAFGPDSRLHVVWTGLNDAFNPVPAGLLNSDIFYSEEKAPAPIPASAASGPSGAVLGARTSTPFTRGLPHVPLDIPLALLALGALAGLSGLLFLARRR
jgi:hypothetical protein